MKVTMVKSSQLVTKIHSNNYGEKKRNLHYLRLFEYRYSYTCISYRRVLDWILFSFLKTISSLNPHQEMIMSRKMIHLLSKGK